MVGIRLIVEMLRTAPSELTSSERVVLVVLAEYARDDTRKCWPGMDTLVFETGLSARQVRRVLADLAARGWEVRVSSGVDRHGTEVFATKGRRTVYRVPVFPQRGTHTAALKGDAHDRLSDPKAAISGTQRRPYPVAKGDVCVPPSCQESSRDPSNTHASDPSRNGKAGPAWLAGAVDLVIEQLTEATGRTYDRRDITNSVNGFLSGKTVTSPGAYVRKCAEENPLQFKPTSAPARYQPEENR